MRFSNPDDQASLIGEAIRRHEHERAEAGRRDLSRFEILERCGQGASSVVYRAWDHAFHRPVALKRVRLGGALSKELVLREAQTSARLRHPNVVATFDAVEENGSIYIVMEFVAGRPLSALLAERRIGPEEAVRLLEKTARGVGHAHALGIVHRDLKPSNILVTPTGEPKVADFGLAKRSDATDVIGRRGVPVGTPAYMAPEQAEGRLQDISPRTDVYALGLILQEATKGAATAALKEVCRKALSADPGRRHPTASEFADDLARLGSG